MKPSIGRIVIYKLSTDDAAQINRRRTNGKAIAERIAKNSESSSAWPLGAQAHIGNEVEAGQEFAMVVVRTWGFSTVNGQVFLDGNDCFWTTSIGEGKANHTWHWPEREE